MCDFGRVLAIRAMSDYVGNIGLQILILFESHQIY